MSDDLITWLRSELDYDERIARRYKDGNYAEYEEHLTTPDWVLADIAAKRAILDRYEDAVRLDTSKPGYDPVARLNVSLAKVLAPELERVVRLLALAYADRPGYRDEWRPA
jgi:hypothetical protein